MKRALAFPEKQNKTYDVNVFIKNGFDNSMYKFVF